MPAVTYSISLSEESAARFERAASEAGLEPSEALCRLARGFAENGSLPAPAGHAGPAEGTPAEGAGEGPGAAEARGAMHEQMRDWKALQSGRRNRAPLPWEEGGSGGEPAAEGGGAGEGRGKTATGREEGEASGEPAPPWHSSPNAARATSNLAAKDIEAADFGVEESSPDANSWLAMQLRGQRRRGDAD